MWFKNCQVFSLKESFDYDAESLEKQLDSQRFLPCSSVDPQTSGWVPPTGNEDAMLVHAANGFIMLALKTEKKLIPSSVLNERLAEKIEELEEREGRKVRKKEKDAMKDEIHHTLVTQAFTQSSVLYGYIDTKKNLVVVNSSSRKKAEDFCNAVRGALGSFKVELPDVNAISIQMTDWLKSAKYPPDLIIEDNCVIEDTREGGSLKVAKQDLAADDIIKFIDHGREVVQMTFSWREEVRFTLKDDFSIKSIKFLEGVQDKASDIFTETDAERFDADFTILTDTLREFINYLLETFETAQQTQAEPEVEMAEA